MQEYLRKISQDDEIDYYDFCQLLDAGTSGNPSRVSSYLSNNKGSSFMRFSYFERNLDKMSFFWHCFNFVPVSETSSHYVTYLLNIHL